MSGWIKLWRRTLDHGHFHMPDSCFKLWVYCLLKAAPFATGELAAGELYLSYKEIQQNLGQQGKTISKSTIAAALRFLQNQGYLVVQAAPLQGMKVKVCSWQRYQAREEGNSSEGAGEGDSQNLSTVRAELLPSTATVPMESPPGTPTVPEPSLTGTLGVPAKASTGTATVPAWYSESTSTGTPTVPVTAREASREAAYGTPKNIGKNTKEYGYKNTPQTTHKINFDKRTTLRDILDQFPRYSSRQTDTLRDYWQLVSQTRKHRNISPSIVAKQMNQWEQYPAEIVLEAITIHLTRHRDKREEYTTGIMRRLVQEQERGGGNPKGGNTSGNHRENTEQIIPSRPTSRYAHLVQDS
ncbi:hypothetical protein Dred_0502 [Desulforamulus reducens MI-1]|uniref:Uncharacterized protein n=1 Tax=Desulforamulus reducens (strain ATCC BAA-1160 / DSM 100696 / MI-1) TaxID=349161 RepID=A4J1U4_DESRM|nr:hypothetical protein [Desulforamulus reducens]ABO49047.1 hypothetical protein Dred_0502 [Desulforamulus reducens MI-1]